MPGKPRQYTATHVFPLPPERLWELLSNTEHLNRIIGLPRVRYAPLLATQTDMLRQASTTVAGVPTHWQEHPFEWIRAQRYSVMRVFAHGPLTQVSAGVTLQPEGTGTRLHVFAQISARHALGAVVAMVLGRKSVRDVLRYCTACVALVQRGAPAPYPRTRTRSAIVPAQMAFLLHRLRRMPVQEALLEALAQHLQDATDEEVLRMRPSTLATAWQAEPLEVLRLFLYATKVGLLNLQWELMCPNCRVPKAEYTTLADLQAQYHCDVCGVDLTADFSRYVELRFSVHPTVRQAEDAIYCLGGPMQAQHILVQQHLAPGEIRDVEVMLDADLLRLRALRANHTAAVTPTASQAVAIEAVYTDAGWTATQLSYHPGPNHLRLHNASAGALVAVLEQVAWDHEAVTAQHVTCLQEFRDLFAAEVLAPGQEISVESLAILFSDLRGSTALYESIGDALAYSRVQRHFTFLLACIRRHQGAVVKTIGDAVMAVFASPETALQAALAIQRDIAAFNASQGITPPLVIKLGVHHGAAIVVNANNRLDYFGRTVNIAARVQGESQGGDIVLTAEMLQHPGVRALLRPLPPVVPFHAVLKGIDGTTRLYRLMLA